MKNLFRYCISLLLIAGFSACNSGQDNRNNADSSTPEHQLRSYYKRLQSTTENNAAVLHLIKYQSTAKNEGAITADRYSGILIPGNQQAPLQLAGYVNADSSIQLVTYDHYTPLDTFTGHFKDGIFSGRKKVAGDESEKFSFKEAYPDGSYHWQVAAYKDSLTLDTSLAKGLKAETDLMTLWPGKDMDSSARSIILDTICLAFFGVNKQFTSAEDLLKAVSDTFLQNNKRVTEEFVHKGGTVRPSFNWNAMASMDLVYNADNKVSLIYTQYQYTGGAHGLQSVYCLVTDMKNGKVLQLSDLFKPAYEKQLRQELEKEFRRQYNIPEGEPLNGDNGLLFDAHLPVSNNFYLTKGGIGFIYNPYQVAPYVVGEINLFLPFSRIAGLLQK